MDPALLSGQLLSLRAPEQDLSDEALVPLEGIAELRNRTIAGAGLDVYDREPLPAGHQLTTLDNVVLLPHLGYVSEIGFQNMYGPVVADIAGFLADSPIRVLS